MVSSTYRRNMTLDGIPIIEKTSTQTLFHAPRQRRRSWTPTQRHTMLEENEWIIPHRTSKPRSNKYTSGRFSPYELSTPRSPPTVTQDIVNIPHSAPATNRTGFEMLERHISKDRVYDTKQKLFNDDNGEDQGSAKKKDTDVTNTTKSIPISLAKPKLVRRISRSADDKEFGQYWNELPKQMRTIEEEERETTELLSLTPRRPRQDTDVHILAFGSPPSYEEYEEKVHRPSITSSPGETPPFASMTPKQMSMTPLRLEGPTLQDDVNMSNKTLSKEIVISSFEEEGGGAGSTNNNSNISLPFLHNIPTEEEEAKSEEEEDLPFAIQDEDGSDDDDESNENLTTEFERLKKSDGGIGELVAKCDNAPMLRAIEIARESGMPYFRREIDRQIAFFEEFEKKTEVLNLK